MLWLPDVPGANAHDAARAGPCSRTEHQHRSARAAAPPVPRLATALVDDADLYQRGTETLIASWEACAQHVGRGRLATSSRPDHEQKSPATTRRDSHSVRGCPAGRRP